MVEGGRLEIVLAVLSRHVGSNPTLSAKPIRNFTLWPLIRWLYLLLKNAGLPARIFYFLSSRKPYDSSFFLISKEAGVFPSPPNVHRSSRGSLVPMSYTALMV